MDATTIDRPFGLPADSIEIELDLPIPPSLNRLRKITAAGRKLLAKWKHEADLHLMARRKPGARNPVRLLTGKFEAVITLNEGATRMDADNAIKAAIDYAVSREFVTDDSPLYMRRVTVQWGDIIDAPSGCRIKLRSLS